MSIMDELHGIKISANCETLINATQNERCIWDATVNASEQEKELAWVKIRDELGCKNGRF